MSAGGHSKTNHEHNTIVLPVCLYDLIDAEQRWSSLSKLMQNQILHTDNLLPQSTAPKLRRHSKLAYISATNNKRVSVQMQQLTNVKLMELLAMVRIMHFSQVDKDDNWINEHIYSVEARTELDRDEPLNLHNSDFGPLVIPGPKINTRIDSSVGMLLYSYQSGWPELDPKLLEASYDSVHQRLVGVRQARLFAIEQADKRVLKFIRSPTERLYFDVYQEKIDSSFEVERVSMASLFTKKSWR